MKQFNDSTTSAKDYPDFEIIDEDLNKNKDLWIPLQEVNVSGYYALISEDDEEQLGFFKSSYYWWYNAETKTWHYNSEDTFVVKEIGYQFAYLVKE